MKSINPSTEKIIQEYEEHSPDEVNEIIEKVNQEWQSWKETTFEYRALLMKNAARLLRGKKETYAQLMTMEMGKIILESFAEIEKMCPCLRLLCRSCRRTVEGRGHSFRCSAEPGGFPTTRDHTRSDAMEFPFLAGIQVCCPVADGRKCRCSETCLKCSRVCTRY